MSDKITLDRDTFKALAADTRVDILKMLGEHKLTLTDLSGMTNMSPSTIKEHLDRLVEVGLIEQEDKGMKWKYYRLTEKGRNIVSPYETKVWILLGTSILVLAGAALSLAGKMAGMISLSAAKAAPQAANLMRAEAEEKVVRTTTTVLSASTTSTIISEAADAGDRMITSGAAAANETLRTAADKLLNSAGHEGLAFAARKAADETVTSTTMAIQRTATTLVEQTTTTTFQHVTTTTHAVVVEASKAAVSQTPYLEMALIGVSFVIAGACVGYLLRRRLLLR